MLQLLKKGIDGLTASHPWHLLDEWHLKQILRQMKLRSIELRIPPFSKIETYRGQGRILSILYIRLIKKNLRALQLFLDNCDIFRIRQILWQRFTSHSLVGESYLPPTPDTVLSSLNPDRDKPIVERVSQSCSHSYWANDHGLFSIEAVAEFFLEEFTWWNTFEHPQLGYIYELRDRTGHGLRWNLETSQVVSCVEPYSDDILFKTSL